MICYFTGTGNSLELAQMLQEATDERLVSLAATVDANTRSLTLEPGERLGFVLPTHCWRVPEYAERFIETCQFVGATSDTYIYLVMSCGDSTGRAALAFRKVLAARKLHLDASFDVLMPDNYVISFKIPSPAAQTRTRNAAHRRMEHLVIPAVIARHPGFHRRRGVGLVLGATNKSYRAHGRRTKPFHAENSCTGCGTCERLCPSHAIEMVAGMPEWTLETCAFCLGCINRCPAQAIEYGTKTRGRGRYVNPVLEETPAS
jgi:Pyruvate/2-oxoacid:ferredoxin oxidoreductase delta subunit